MDFFQHTTNWIKGEILEAIIMAVFGVLILLSSFLLWKWGLTPNARTLVIPLLIVGLIPVIAGVSATISNNKRLIEYESMWNNDQQQFKLDEKARVEGFDEIFKYSYPAAILLTIGGAILFFLVGSPLWKSISLCMMVLGLMAYIIDHFAAERAIIYLEKINESLSDY